MPQFADRMLQEEYSVESQTFKKQRFARKTQTLPNGAEQTAAMEIFEVTMAFFQELNSERKKFAWHETDL